MSALEAAINRLSETYPDQSEADYVWSQVLKNEAATELAALTAELLAERSKSARLEGELAELKAGQATVLNWIESAAVLLRTERKP